MTKDVQSLAEFARAERRKDCRVCNEVPEDVMEQMREASRKKIPRETQLRWLNEVVGIQIVLEDLVTHYNGQHHMKR